MCFQLKSFFSLGSISVLVSLAFINSSFAADAPPASPSKEMRQQMALAHEKMAACLRSDRAFTECRQEMMQSCASQSAAFGCGMMMGEGMQMRRQIRSGTQQSSTSTSKSK